jgi:hypothetical protein
VAMLRANDEPQHWTSSPFMSVAFPGRTEGVRKIAKRFGVNAAACSGSSALSTP